jgi:dihydrolipoamide dehydrogenase
MRSVDNGKKKVALIEYRKGGTGGTCVSRGCIPTKALLRSAEVYAEVKNAKKLGIIVDGARPDMKAIQKGKQQVVTQLKFGLDNFLLKSRGVKRITGKARLLDPHTVEITDNGKVSQITAENIIIATGSEAVRIPVFNIDGKKIMTSDELLNIDWLPKSIVIAGAGVVGMEIAYLLRTLDVEVTVADLAPQVLPLVRDKDTADTVKKTMEKYGIKFHLGQGIKEMHVDGEDQVVCTLAD